MRASLLNTLDALEEIGDRVALGATQAGAGIPTGAGGKRAVVALLDVIESVGMLIDCSSHPWAL
jgi:hypothetical protein